MKIPELEDNHLSPSQLFDFECANNPKIYENIESHFLGKNKKQIQRNGEAKK